MSNYGKELSVYLQLDATPFQKAISKVSSVANKTSEKISKSFNKVGNEIAKPFKKATSTVSKQVNKMANSSNKAVRGIGKTFQKVGSGIDKVAKGINTKVSKSFGKLKTSASKVFSGIKTVAQKGFTAIKNASLKSFEGIKNGASKTANKMKEVFNKAFNKMKGDSKEAESKVSSNIEGISNSLNSLKGILATYASISVFNGLVDGSMELNKSIGRVGEAFKSAGGKVKLGTQTFKNFHSVLGDADRATETTQLLSKITTDEERLLDFTNSLTGVYAQFGDSLPIESLAESMNETQKVGEVTGVLADALNWAGMSEEKFNDQLAKCNSEASRSKLIQKTLAKLYGESGKSFQEANAPMIELYASQMRLEEVQAKLGESLIPIKSEFTDFAYLLLNIVAPHISKLAEEILPKLEPAFSKVTEWMQKVDWDAWISDIKEIGGYIGETLIGLFSGLSENLGSIAEAFGLYNENEDAGKGMGALKKFFKWTADNAEGIADGLMIIGAALTASKIAVSIAGIAKALGLIASTGIVGIVAGAIAGIIAAIVIFGDEIDAFGEKIIGWLQPIGDSVGEAFDGWYEKYFEGALEATGRFFRGETKWQKSLKDSWDTWGRDIKKNWNSVKDECGKFWDSIASEKNVGKMKGFLNGIIKVLNNGIGQFLTGINAIIKGVNWVYKKISGSESNKFGEINVEKWKVPLLAKGTNNWQGGTAIVGEAGRELVSDSKLGTFVANSPMLLPLSKGASVLRNSKTEKLLRGIGVPAFAKGTNEGFFDGIFDAVGDIWDFLSSPKELWNKILGKINLNFGDNPIISGLADGIKNIFSGSFVTDWIGKLFKDNEDKMIGANFSGSGKGYAQAMTWARKALSIAGYRVGTKEFSDFMTAFKIVGRYESNYNNSSINKWDSNAKKGTPSAGWLQFIQPTFNANAFKGYTNWSNGLHQALAFINYANRRYGGALGIPGVKSILRGGKYKPYANGGLINNPTMALMGEAGTEAVVPLSNAKALKPFGQAVMNAIQEETTMSTGGSYEFTIPLYIDGKEVAKATAKFTQEELNKLEKRGNRLKGQR